MYSIVRLLPVISFLLSAIASASISVSGVEDKKKYSNTVTFTITADPAAATTIATLDGESVAVGSSVMVTSIQYHELVIESRTDEGALVDTETVRFIVKDSAARGSTEDGIPVHTPYRSVNDAPSAFVGSVFNVVAPAAWPAGLPIPIATTLRTVANEPLWLNGTVRFRGLPGTSLQMRRGWGSVTAPAAEPGTLQLDAQLAGLADSPVITIEDAPAFTDVSGSISSNTTWPTNSRMHVTGSLTIEAGATLEIGEGTIVTIYTGSGTNGSAAEIIVNGSLEVNGLDGSPVVFAPDNATGHWGGIELPTINSNITASHTIFTGAGEDSKWFDNHSGYATHRSEQALFLVAGSASGTATGASLVLDNCYCIDSAGQMMNSKSNTLVDLQYTLMQRAITCGELSGSKVIVDRSALIEFPDESAEFADEDNDSIYLTNGDLSFSNSVIGYSKDDGIDSGGNGGGNPYTPESDITPLVSTNNWFEGIFHEGNSLSGTREVSYNSCVFFNCGQGVEAGYSSGSSGDGPNATIDGCLFVSNIVGVRWGDNYGGGYNYNGTMEVKNSILLNSLFKDAFSGQWRTDQAAGWIYQTTATNTYGRPYFNVHDNHISQPDPVHHPLNTAWDSATHGVLIEPFMPVPGSNVGVAVSSYDPPQQDTSDYPGAFTVRLSTFSSKSVTVDWVVLANSSPQGGVEVSLASGTLDFAPGETLKILTPAIVSPENYSIIRFALANPTNAEVTGEAWFFKAFAEPQLELVSLSSSGWRYRETRNDPPADWKAVGFDDSSPAATEWLPCTLPAGFATGTQFSPAVSFNTTPGYGGDSGDKTKAYYFRKIFTVDDPAAFSGLTFKVRRDDGLVMWLNDDSEPAAVSASSSFSGPYIYDSLAPNNNESSEFQTYTVPVSKLVAGTNVIAIELHQTSLNSSDLLLDCELIAGVISLPELMLTTSGADLLLYWFDSAAMLEESTNLGFWAPVPTASSPLSFQPAQPKRFFRLRR